MQCDDYERERTCECESPCDEEGAVVNAEDVFDKLRMAKEHYEKVGLGADYVQQFVR